MNDNPIRVRFAPSPTGHLHIGGARTALYNWLYARKTGGSFILRIEDTDAERSTRESYESILTALEWLGLDWDEGPIKGGPYGPYQQSARQVLYHTEVQKLLESGHAYRCFCTQAELEELRQEVAEQGGALRYDERCRNLPDDEVEQRVADGVPNVIRIKIPKGETRVRDVIRGVITFNNKELDDFVLIRSDGRPTYNFAASVDDAKMRISHIIRGDDHLSNTPKQVVVYKALGYPLPKFVHLPMILGPDRTRLSKRHGATSVEEFAKQGYTSEGLVNYLALLGWSLDGKTEFFTRESLIKNFSLKRIGKNPAAFDPDKLDHIDGEHFKRMDVMRRADLVFKRLEAENIYPGDFRVKEWANGSHGSAGRSNGDSRQREELPRLAIILKVIGNRLRNLKNVPAMMTYFYKDDFPRDPEAYDKFLSSPETADHLARLARVLEEVDPFDRTEIEKVTRALADELGVSAADLIHPTRVALTGQSTSPDLFSVIHLLGRDKSVERLEQAANHITASA